MAYKGVYTWCKNQGGLVSHQYFTCFSVGYVLYILTVAGITYSSIIENDSLKLFVLENVRVTCTFLQVFQQFHFIMVSQTGHMPWIKEMQVRTGATSTYIYSCSRVTSLVVFRIHWTLTDPNKCVFQSTIFSH